MLNGSSSAVLNKFLAVVKVREFIAIHEAAVKALPGGAIGPT
jgi:hypothetical protein